ncbi:hypothetical protein Forpi1262_v007115 [Fusarium oxysporum f. sp. raphani]|uniref:Uncharacterized protein n=1 Tax=Fusarium oxysporum f. sp. raphani TaxID=96318 RepID=A0A8J5U837_FUSOX|nr:hypothetical protein Forpi1262_v007115 [Fusarium oxysporum f. sp. raphani]
MQALNDIKTEPKHAANTGQQILEGIRESHETQNETKAAARESINIGRTVLTMVREIKNADQYNQPSLPRTYASVAAGNRLATSMHNPLSQNKAPPAQVLREITVNIRNPLTIASLRAMNPRSLKSHVDRAIEQSGNEHIENIKTVSTNQLKSGDLSIKTATTTEIEVLRQFAEDWEHRLGNGAAVRIPTHGVLVHGIRTSSMDVSGLEDTRDSILQENRPFIPSAEIKYIGWLTRKSTAKAASSIIVEFTRPQDANKIIDEGLIWHGEVFQCELYDRSCRLRQCFNCQANSTAYTWNLETEDSKPDFSLHVICPTLFEKPKLKNLVDRAEGDEEFQMRIGNWKRNCARTMHHETYHWIYTVSDPWCGPDEAYMPYLVRDLAVRNSLDTKINAENFALPGLAIYIMNTFNLKEVPYQSLTHNVERQEG